MKIFYVFFLSAINTVINNDFSHLLSPTLYFICSIVLFHLLSFQCKYFHILLNYSSVFFFSSSFLLLFFSFSFFFLQSIGILIHISILGQVQGLLFIGIVLSHHRYVCTFLDKNFLPPKNSFFILYTSPLFCCY